MVAGPRAADDGTVRGNEATPRCGPRDMDTIHRVVMAHGDDVLVEHGPRLEFHRRQVSNTSLRVVGVALLVTAILVGVLANNWGGAAMIAGFVVVCWFAGGSDTLDLGLTRPLARIDRRLGIVDAGGEPCARLDELEIVLTTSAFGNTFELRAPGVVACVFVEHPPSESPRLAKVLQAVGLRLAETPADGPYRRDAAV